MATIISLFVATSLVLTVVSTSNECEDDAMQSFVNKNMALTGRYLYNHLLKNPHQSHSVATLPILTVIAQAALHSEGNNFRQMAQWLNLNTKDEIRQVFSSLIRKFNNDTDVNLTFTVFGDNKDSFSTQFEQNFKHIANGDVGYVDYNDVCDATDHINYWFKKQYKDLSSNVIESDYLWNRGQGLVFGTYMDTITSWDHPFNPKGVVDIEFRKSIHEVQSVVALYGNAFARYAELPQLNAKLLLLSSKGVQDSVLWLYPNDPADLLGILHKMQDPNVFNGALSQLRATCLKLHVTVGQAHAINRYSTFIPEINLELSGLNGVSDKDYRPSHVFSILQQLHLFADKGIRDGPINTPACPDYNYPLVRFDHPFAYFSLNEHKSPVFAGVFYGY